MNSDFKRMSYIITILLFLIGIIALVAVSAAKYFAFDELVVTVSQIVSLVSFFVMFINCVYSKSKYNSACIKFADYILTNRRKDAERKAADEEKAKELQNIMTAAEHDREKAVEAALRQGRSESAHTADASPVSQRQSPAAQQSTGTLLGQPVVNGQASVNRQQPSAVQPQSAGTASRQQMPMQPRIQQVSPSMPVQPPMGIPQPVPMPIPMPAQMPMPMQYAATAPRLSVPQRDYRDERETMTVPNEEMLYNEYGEPVMVRRRVRKSAYSSDGEVLYDGQGNPVIRRNQGLWEPLEQRHEIVLKVETAPGVSVSQPSRFTPNSAREDEERTDV